MMFSFRSAHQIQGIGIVTNGPDGSLGVRLAKWTVGLMLATSSLSVMAAWDLPHLMETLAKNKSGRATFVETKRLALLDKPVESSGELLYTAPDRLEKRTFKPKAESMILNGNELLVERGRQKYQLQLQVYPELAAFIDSIRSTLAGDLQALERNYQLTLSGQMEKWALQLAPLDKKMLAVVLRIQISGAQDQVTMIEITQADGDSSFMTIKPMVPAQ